jgi:hypothetical protein
MRLFMKKRTPTEIEFGILYGGIALIALLAARFVPVVFLPSCAFKGLTGVPCPTCGATRSVMYLAQGSILSAMALNPLVAAGFLAAILYFLYSLITLLTGVPRIRIAFTDSEKNVLRIGAGGIVLLNWTYLVFNL